MALAAPRGEAKSTLVSQIFVIWCVVRGLKHYIPIIMDAFEQAATMLAAIQAELESNARMQMDFPEICGQTKVWNAGVCFTANGVKIQAFGSVIPDSMIIEFTQAASKGGSSGLYEKLLRYLDERVTLAVPGQTLTSGQTRGGGGSMALGQVHNEVRLDLRMADARQLAFTLNRDLVRPVIDLNRGARKAYPKIRVLVEEPEDLKLLADSLQILVPMGLEVEASIVRDKLGLPDPPKEKTVKLLHAPATAPPPPPKVPQEGPDLAAQSRQGCPHCAAHAAGQPEDPADHLTDQLEGLAQDSLARLLEPVQRLVRGAHSLEEIRDGLLELYPAMANDRFAELFTQAMTAAALSGRFEVAGGR